jgi:hypothetical protein
MGVHLVILCALSLSPEDLAGVSGLIDSRAALRLPKCWTGLGMMFWFRF